MPAQSKQQQKFMGMVHALQKGDMDPKDASPEVKKVAQSMKKKDAKDFASTSHKGLPRKVKQEILNKLKEYANKMGRDHLGGDDYTSKRKGGLRDFDGYDNVDYNKDMPMDESNLKGQLAGDSVQDIIKSIGSRFVSGEIKNTKRDGKTYIKLKDEKFGSGVVKILKSRFGIDAKLDYYGGKGKIASSPSVSFFSDSILEGPVPQNWMQGRTSDYHTKLRGKEREYDDTNFEKDNSGQPDLEEAGLKGIENIPSNKKLSKLSDNEKLNILQSSGNIISFHIPDWAKGRYKMWQVISAGKIKKKKDLDGEIIYFLPGKGPQKSSPTYPTLKDLLNGVDWDTMEMRRESVNESFDKVEHLKLLNLALRTMPGSQKQKEIIRKLNKVRVAGGMRPLKETSIIEYASKLTLSYLPADEEEIEKMNEGTMIRRAVDIAQELLPKDTWSRFASDGKKNAEFVKNVVKDLTQSLNRFYKNHNISVRIKEEEGDSNVDMVLGVLSILRQIEDKENRQKVAVDMIKKFKEQNIDFDYKEFLELMKEYNK